ncbi:MAG: sensor histidine kinase [Caulobacteraceae bacterium]
MVMQPQRRGGQSADHTPEEQLGIVEAIFGQALTGAILLDGDYRIVRANERFASRFKVTPQACRGRPFGELVPDPVLLERLAETARTLRPSTVTGGFQAGPAQRSEVSHCHWSVSPVLDDAGGLLFLFVMGVDLSDVRRAEEQLRVRETIYQSAFTCMNEGVVFQSADGSIVAVNPAAERLLGLSSRALLGRDSNAPEWQSVKEDGTPFPGEQHPSMVTLRTGDPQSDVVMGVRRPDGERVWISINSQPVVHEGEAEPSAVVTTFHDVTGRKAAEEHQAKMLHELNHRVKNTLAVVQSIAVQTLKTTPEPAAFAQAFNARLMALSQSHEVLTRNDWTAASLLELMAEQLRPYQGEGHRIRLTGPDVRLAPKVATALSLALGELATNAVKHGALAGEQGSVSVSWERTADRLLLIWREQGGSEVRAPMRRGLGMRLLERALPDELGGSTRITFDPAGLICEMEFPLE